MVKTIAIGKFHISHVAWLASQRLPWPRGEAAVGLMDACEQRRIKKNTRILLYVVKCLSISGFPSPLLNNVFSWPKRAERRPASLRWKGKKNEERMWRRRALGTHSLSALLFPLNYPTRYVLGQSQALFSSTCVCLQIDCMANCSLRDILKKTHQKQNHSGSEELCLLTAGEHSAATAVQKSKIKLIHEMRWCSRDPLSRCFALTSPGPAALPGQGPRHCHPPWLPGNGRLVHAQVCADPVKLFTRVLKTWQLSTAASKPVTSEVFFSSPMPPGDSSP